MNSNRMIGGAIEQMLATHPRPSELPRQLLTECVEACVICATTCTACADACLAEKEVTHLLDCIRTNLDCAEICQATGNMLVRQTGSVWQQLYRQVETCQLACNVCGPVCESHADMHEHCRICADVCRDCVRACTRLLETFPARTQ